MPLDSATTRVAFETRVATWGIFLIGRLFANNRFVRQLTVSIFKRFRVGHSTCNVSVRALGWRYGKRAVAAVHFAGDVEATTTARLSALQIELVREWCVASSAPDIAGATARSPEKR